MIDYYNRQIDTDERLTDALVEMQKGIRKGLKLGAKGRGAQEVGVSITETLKKYGVTDNLSPFVQFFDFSKAINASRVARERATFQRRELLKWALAHPEEAKAEVAELRRRPEPPKARKAVGRTAKEPARIVHPEVAEIRLQDWGFMDLMRGIRLTWRVLGEKGYEAHVTTHALEPQVYQRELVELPGGELYEKRTYVSGAFKTGKLTAEAMEKLAQEGREQISERIPGRRLETREETLSRLRFLMR